MENPKRKFNREVVDNIFSVTKAAYEWLCHRKEYLGDVIPKELENPHIQPDATHTRLIHSNGHSKHCERFTEDCKKILEWRYKEHIIPEEDELRIQRLEKENRGEETEVGPSLLTPMEEVNLLKERWKRDARALKTKKQRIDFDPPYQGDYLQLIKRLPSVPGSKLKRSLMISSKFELTQDHIQASRQLVSQSPDDLRTFYEVRDAARAIKYWMRRHEKQLTEDHKAALRELKFVKGAMETNINYGNPEQHTSTTINRYKNAFSALLDIAINLMRS
jgi:hypothetical protein